MFNTKDITVLFAAAGAGKTTYLLDCVAKEMQTYRPEDIAFVSYTRKGASEGRERLIKNLSIDSSRLEFFKTLHALTFASLGYKAVNIFSAKHAKLFNEMLGFNLTTSTHAMSNNSDDKLMGYYDMIRGGHTPLRDMDDGFDKDRYARLVSAYEGYKKHNKLVDFTDCLLEFVERGEALPVKVAFIDEVQDLSLLMWNVCYVAFAKAEKVYVAGDDFQSIYTYSGARPDILISMASKFKTVKLEISYRLPKSVYRYAKAITNVIGNKMEKDYVPFKDSEGLVEFVNDRSYLSSMIEDRQKESWMLLFRNNVHMVAVEEELRSHLIPYHTPRGFVIGENDLGKIKKYYNFRLAGYKNSIQRDAFMAQHNIKDFDDDFTESTLVYGDHKYYCLAYVEKFGLETLVKMSASKPAILVSTVHRVKGGEAKNVAFFCDCTRKVHRNRFRDFDSELRLLYVAFTRAKENLYIVRSQSNYGIDDVIDALKEYNEL